MWRVYIYNDLDDAYHRQPQMFLSEVEADIKTDELREKGYRVKVQFDNE